MLARRDIRVAVIGAAQLALQNVVGKTADQFTRIRRAETNRVVHRVFQRVAFVRESGWDIQNIAGLQLFINDGFKRIDLEQIRVRAMLLQLQLLAYAPAAATGSLNDKDIVLIQMRTHAAARDGKGDHQIVNTPVWQRAERTHQRSGRFMPVVYGLNQQRPVVLAEVVVTLERAVADLPFTILMTDQTAIDFAFHRQSRQFVRGERINEVVEPAF
ncbi:hypothetical protein CKO_01924 [Citrobacter koseri ATCC BAA-895]|uniref:Uncharacterized protein n=1 Tax=Citrobacter koseri (strain ATCC BAA-895 / CDC 4225-83 / SGSC4696) TaxID=290338 RepID=A8AHT8_CITK8|nr:hypothetical protein CKO_01924 [Citrobacter koseri ATCC BAA-895]